MNGARSSRWSRGLAGLTAVAGLLLASGLGLLAAWPPAAVVETGHSGAYPALQPRAYSLSEARVMAGAGESLSELVGGPVEAGSGAVSAVVEGPLGALDAEVTVRVLPNGAGGALVFVRSGLIRGRADFGQNARNIEAVFAVLERNLGVSSAQDPHR